MDPQSCLERILSAITERDMTEFNYACSDLADWLGRGGFPPTMPSIRLGSHFVVGLKQWRVVRRFRSDHWAIQAVDPHDVRGNWELVRLDGVGEAMARYSFDNQKEMV